MLIFVFQRIIQYNIKHLEINYKNTVAAVLSAAVVVKFKNFFGVILVGN